MHAYTSQNSVFDSPVTNLLSVLTVLIEVLSCAHGGGGGGGGGGLNDFKFGTSVGHFLNDSASMAVKGLIMTSC